MEEEEPKQKSEEKNDEEPANTKDGTEGSQEGDGKPSEPDVSTVKKDEMSETTEYDCSTDDSESLRLIYSSTDQSNCCSGLRVKWNILINEIFSAEICSRRSSSGSYPALHRVGGRVKTETESRSRSQEDLSTLSSKINLIERRKRLLLNHQSASLDLADN